MTTFKTSLAAGDSIEVTGTGLKYSASTTLVTVSSPAIVPPVDPPPTPSTGGVLISQAEVMKLPTSGSAWTALNAAANSTISPDLSDQDSAANVRTLAAALVCVRTNSPTMWGKVVVALKALKSSPTGRALALGRELGAYVIAADLIQVTNAELGYDFAAFLRALIAKKTTEAGTLVECMQNRPNNWGAHAAGSLACVYAYLKDAAGLKSVATVAQGWAGAYAIYHGFEYGDTSWQEDPAHPVGVNPKGAKKGDGAQPEEMRRGGNYPSIGSGAQNYAPEALQGHLLKALVLARNGYPEVIEWSDRALLRAVDYIYGPMKATLSGDDSWQPHGWKHLYGSAFTHPLPSSTTPGKNMGFTDWLYG